MAIKAARLYKIKSDVTLDWIYAKLAVKNIEFTDVVFFEKQFQLGSLVKNLKWHQDRTTFEGTLAFETLEVVERLDGSIEPVVNTQYVDFYFTQGSTMFIAFSRKDNAERAATLLSQWIGPPGYISNISFSSHTIETFLNENDHTLKRCYWRNLMIPGIDRVHLNGSNLGPTDEAQRYDELGDKNYITVELHTEHLTLTISSSGAIGFVSKIDREGMFKFLKKKIFPLIYV